MQNQSNLGFQTEEVEKLASVLTTFLNEQTGVKLTSFAITGLVTQINTLLQEIDSKLAQKEKVEGEESTTIQ